MNDRGHTVTIMVHRDDTLESKHIRIPLWALRVLTVTGLVVAVLLVLGIVLYAPIVRTAARVPSMNREIERLRAENAQVMELARTLEDMEARYSQVRTMLGSNVLPDRPRPSDSAPVARPIVVGSPSDPTRYQVGLSTPLYWPLDERGFVTRGPAQPGVDTEVHSGIDIAVPTGSAIRAAGGGVVEEAGEDAELGLFVRISHPDEFLSVYGHASRLLVAAGDTVDAGQVIALSGSTGRSTAPHLHYEVRKRGRFVDPRTLSEEK
jgi:murein DD-endopeptidase MepM/ murein hydrolase activator NlpD